MKKTAMIFSFLFLLTAFAAAATVSVIIMKDGKVYKGRILDLEDGVYTVEINGRKYNIKEEEVQKTGWETDGREPEKKSEKIKMRDGAPGQQEYYFYIKPYGSWLMSGTTDYSGVFPTGIPGYGLEAGIDSGNRTIRTSFGISFLAAKAGGTLSYTDLIDGYAVNTSPITTEKYILQGLVDLSVKFGDNIPVAVYGRVGVGAGVITDVIDSYPVVDDFYPLSGHYERMSRKYMTFSAVAGAGASYYVSNNIILSAGAGYLSTSANIYKETEWRMYGYESPPNTAIGGIILDFNVKFRI